MQASYAGADKIDRVEFRKLAEDEPLAARFAQFEQRVPNLGVHLGLRRDCGSTLSRVGTIQKVRNTELTNYIFEGRNR